MHTRLPKETATSLFEALNGRDLAALSSLLAEDAVFHFPGLKPLSNRVQIERFFKTLFFKYPTLVFSIGRIIADDRCAAVEWANKGETQAGKPYENAGVTIVELDGERIAYLSDTFKDTSFLNHSTATV